MENIIKRIYEETCQTTQYEEAQEKNRDKYNIAFEKFVHNEEDEDLFFMANFEEEYFGFIQGFKCAMQLKEECGII